VLGLPDDQRLYVVLPTGVCPDLPFSCNAPFLQDPARTGLKEPTVSPTNQWLLRRLGELAAQDMCGWIGNADLSMEDRAEGYDLLPQPPQEANNVDDDCASQIGRAFGEVCEGEQVLLTEEGELVETNTCLAPPTETYHIWSSRQLLQVFGDSDDALLCRHISDVNRDLLSDWEWVKPVTATQVIQRLMSGKRPPRPREWEGLLRLWEFVQSHIGWDYGGTKRKALRVVPVKGQSDLFAATEVVRLSSAKSIVAPEDWEFLSNHMLVLDRNWLNRLSELQKKGKQEEGDTPQYIEAARQLLADLGLDTPSQPDALIIQAAASMCAADEVAIADIVRLTHIAAALDAQVPPTFNYVSRSGSLNEASDGMVYSHADGGGCCPYGDADIWRPHVPRSE
jgi:hypothetical protein